MRAADTILEERTLGTCFTRSGNRSWRMRHADRRALPKLRARLCALRALATLVALSTLMA
jgi:hypothetical protein